jgi:hypothetical protein
MSITPSFQEDHISHVPALQLLQNLGYTYLSPQEVILRRRGRFSNVLLEGVLAECGEALLAGQWERLRLDYGPTVSRSHRQDVRRFREVFDICQTVSSKSLATGICQPAASKSEGRLILSTVSREYGARVDTMRHKWYSSINKPVTPLARSAPQGGCSFFREGLRVKLPRPPLTRQQQLQKWRLQRLIRIFHIPIETPIMRRVRARGLQARTFPVGRVPSRGVQRCATSGLTVTDVDRADHDLQFTI